VLLEIGEGIQAIAERWLRRASFKVVGP
jgi:hypothetical protein